MKYVIFDTETNGLPSYRDPADHPNQPWLAELAMIFLDESLAVEREFQAYIKPDGWAMTPDATAVNGLTTEFLIKNGGPIQPVLDEYAAAIESGYVAVAFNAQHDCKVMRGSLRRGGRSDYFDRTPNICVMRGLTGVCKMPALNGRKGYKFPKLAEAMAHFNFPQEGAHSAMGDTRSALRLFRKMVELGVCPEPEVHRAKDGTKSGEALKARGGTPEPSTRPAREPKAQPAPRLPLSDAEIADQDIPS